MSNNRSDRMELFTVVLQVGILSTAFALMFRWETDTTTKVLVGINLVLLVHIFAMFDRLRRAIQLEIFEVRKEQGFTQYLVLSLRFWTKETSTSESRHKTGTHLDANPLLQMYIEERDNYDAGFKAGFETGANGLGDFIAQREALADMIGLIVYLLTLLGGSLLIGWALSRLLSVLA